MALIRPGTLTDRFTMMSIRDDALEMFGSHGSLGDIPESSFDAQSGFRVRLACENGIPLGYAMAQSCGDDLYLRQMFVLRQANHQGIGTQLLQELLTHAAESGYKTVSLITSANAPWTMPFYEKFGFAGLSNTQLPAHISQNLEAAWVSREIQSIPGYLPIVGMSRSVQADDASLHL